MIQTEQIKAARAMLGLSQKQLAERAGVAVATLNNIERGAQTDPKTSTMRAIQSALEVEGMEFISDSLGKIGIVMTPHNNTPSDSATVLIVDDNKSDRALYSTWLQHVSGKDYRIIEAESVASGLNAFTHHQPDCIIIDFMMRGADGFQLISALKEQNKCLPPIIFVTGMHNDILKENASSAGVHSYLNKQNLSKETFHEAVTYALQQ